MPAGVVHAVFYSFADGEVARHVPRVWATTTPEAALPAADLQQLVDDLTPIAQALDAVGSR